jgi:uncharacterized protein (TIGR03083 family)
VSPDLDGQDIVNTLADRTIASLRGNHDRLAAQVQGFSPADLDRPSGSALWDVAQVLSHLGSGAEIGLAALVNGLAGLDAPDSDYNESVWDRWNAMSQQEKADGFVVAGERLVSAYEDLNPQARAETTIRLSFLPFPVDIALLTGLRLSEAVMHAWDVQVAFDPAAALGDDETDAMVDQFVGPNNFLVGFLGKPDGLAGGHADIRVETTNPARVLGIVVTDAVALNDHAPGHADSVLSGPAEAVLRLISGRLAPEHTPASVSLDSAAVTLDQLRRVFPGF